MARAHSHPYLKNRIGVANMSDNQHDPIYPGQYPSGEDMEEIDRAQEAALAAQKKKAEQEKHHMLVALRQAKYIRNCRRRGVKPKRVSKLSLAIIKKNSISTRPRWPKRVKRAAASTGPQPSS